MTVRILTPLLLLLTLSWAQAQNITPSSVPTITTKGYAETEVTPDIVYLSVSLKEFYEDGNLRKKVTIDELEKQLYESAMKIGVGKEDFTIQNIYSYNYKEDKKRKKEDLLQARQYRIKVTNLHGISDLFDGVNPKGIQSTSINEYEHSNKKEIQKNLQIEAVKDAMESAEILAKASDNKIVKTLLISDNKSFNNSIMPRTQMAYAESADMAVESTPLNIDIKPMKMTCQIDAVFQIDPL